MLDAICVKMITHRHTDRRSRHCFVFLCASPPSPDELKESEKEINSSVLQLPFPEHGGGVPESVNAGKLALQREIKVIINGSLLKLQTTHVLDEDRRARNDPSMPRSMSNDSASTPEMDGWNHLQMIVEGHD